VLGHCLTFKQGVDISYFINNLPGGSSTADFRSDDASGSTSQAANIQEALEAGKPQPGGLGHKILTLVNNTSKCSGTATANNAQHTVTRGAPVVQCTAGIPYTWVCLDGPVQLDKLHDRVCNKQSIILLKDKPWQSAACYLPIYICCRLPSVADG
jgi:hypothetical protein